MDVIKFLGLDRFTKALVVSSLVDIRKPDRTIFELTGSRLGFANNRESMLFVGDNPIVDIAGAHEAAMKTAWVSGGADWRHNNVVPNLVIDSVGELVALMTSH